ncbi:MAG TPA: 2-C-methyl-D-erythritol 4-phosphate cytidylyltransferase [Cytophagaceae bacterium]|nr:2-C-methyl-D-erythritol 4-phosphate cytidylyltransferase [Cytophagaceae bacterium]
MLFPPKYALIVAGGSGLRMGTDVPKQFLELGGIPVLIHTLRKYHEAFDDITILLVLPEVQKEYWQALCKKYSFDIPHQIINGGATRFQSVRNGLQSIATTNGLVAIHDGVRPFVSKEVIQNSFAVAERSGNAIAAVPMKDSIRVVETDGNRAVERTAYRIIQTPQTFQLSLIKKAFETPELPSFTDDASVLEQAGHAIHLIEGSYENIKITTPEDLVWGNALLEHKKRADNNTR